MENNLNISNVLDTYEHRLIKFGSGKGLTMKKVFLDSTKIDENVSVSKVVIENGKVGLLILPSDE